MCRLKEICCKNDTKCGIVFIEEGVDSLSQLEKLLQRIMNNPKTVRFEELDKIKQIYVELAMESIDMEGSEHE